MNYFVQLHFLIFITGVYLFAFGDAGFGSGEGTDPFGFGDVKETCKSPPSIAQNFNGSWTTNIKSFQFLMMSKEHLTRLTQHLSHSLRLNPLTAQDLQLGCFILTQVPSPPGSLHTITGYVNKTMDTLIYPLGFNGQFRANKLLDDIDDKGGISVVSLSNNLSFNLAVNCWDDGVGTWMASSSNFALTEEETYAIEQHVLALGFNPDNFIKIDFSKCARY